MGARRAGPVSCCSCGVRPSPLRPVLSVMQSRSRRFTARRQPRYGYRRVWALLRRRGRQVTKKPVHRLWKRAIRQVRKVTRQRGPARTARVPVQALQPGHVWADDVLQDQCRNGTPLKVLTGMDACTREGLAIEAATSWPAPRVLTVLERLVGTHGTPNASGATSGR